MSVIQTIRNRYGKIAGAVIAIALIGFIISDARNGSFGNLFGAHDSSIMKINGSKVDPKEYQQRLKEYEILYTMFNKGRPLDDATRAQMNEQVIQMLIYETIVGEQCDKLGIQTSEEEKKSLIYSENADPLVRQFQIEGQQVFLNQQTGQFDPSIIPQLEKAFVQEPQKYDPTGKYSEQWDAVKNYVRRMSRINKYNTLFGLAVYTPIFVAKHVMADEQAMASIRFVKVPFTDIPENELKLSDDELKNYMQQHAANFQSEQPTRSVEYVSFDIVPSSADTARQLDALMQMKGDLANAKDLKSFVNSKSDEANSYSEAYVNKRTYMSRYADTIMSLPVGDIYGPYYDNGSYKITRVVDKKTYPDSVKCRHILIRTKDRDKEVLSDSVAKARIDSVAAAIAAGASFDTMVMRYSEDEGSNKKGGEYTFTLQQRPDISKEFGDFLFEGKKGEHKTVKVTNANYSGYHYIEILDQVGIAPAVQVATVTKVLAPSDSTVNAIYAKANEFAGKNPTAAEFDAAVKKQNLDKRIGDNIKISSFTIPGLGPAREMIRWAFEHKIGEISPVFQLGDQRYVVAKLTGIADKGVMELTAANRPLIERRAKEEKAADLISKKYASAGSLDAIAGKANQQVQQADTVRLSGGFIPGLGFEPKVAGYAFCPTFQPNTTSPGIKGQGGVYFISVINRTTPQVPDGPMMQGAINQLRMQQEMQVRNSVSQLLQQSVIRKADIKYNVSNF